MSRDRVEQLRLLVLGLGEGLDHLIQVLLFQGLEARAGGMGGGSSAEQVESGHPEKFITRNALIHRSGLGADFRKRNNQVGSQLGRERVDLARESSGGNQS